MGGCISCLLQKCLGNWQRNCLVARASATLLVLHHKQCINCGSEVDVRSSYSWYFDLNKKLDLNLSFVAIDFFFDHLSCSHGSLKIHTQAMSWKKQVFLFCGIYTAFNLYPNSRKVFVEVYSNRCFYFKIQAFFVPIDANILKTNILKKYFSKLPAVNEVFLKQMNTTIEFFLLQVTKSAIVTLQASNRCELVAHDGPDISAVRVKPHGGLFKMSTFQCFVVQKSTLTLTCAIKLDKEIHSRQFHTLKREGSVILPSDDCLYNAQMCVRSFRSHLGQQLSARLISLSVHKEAQTPNCQHGGLSLLDGQGKEISTVCQNKTSSGPQIFYSSDTTMVLVVFWYSQHIAVHTQLNVTNIQCRAVVIDTCFLHAVGYYWGEFDRRNSILQAKTQSSGLNLRMTHSNSLFFSVDNGTCAVLQLRPNKHWTRGFTTTNACLMRLRPEFDWGAGRQLTLTVTGVMRWGNYSDIDIIKFEGSLKKLSWRAHNLLEGKCVTRQCKSHLFVSPKSCNDSVMSDTVFGFETKLKLPIHDNIFQITVEQLLYAKTTVEIVFKSTVLKEDDSVIWNGPQMLSETYSFTQKSSQVSILCRTFTMFYQRDS